MREFEFPVFVLLLVEEAAEESAAPSAAAAAGDLGVVVLVEKEDAKPPGVRTELLVDPLLNAERHSVDTIACAMILIRVIEYAIAKRTLDNDSLQISHALNMTEWVNERDTGMGSSSIITSS